MASTIHGGVMKDIYEAIEEIANTPSKNEKEALLKKYDSPLLRFICEAAYNPRKRYYMDGKIDQMWPIQHHSTNEIVLEDLQTLLNGLSTREYSGDNATTLVCGYLMSLTEQHAEIVKRVIKKDLRAGFSDSTINKVWKGLIPEYPYMRCALFNKVDTSKWTWKEGVYSQEKLDGMFANVTHHEDGTVSILSRQGSQFPMSEFFAFEAEVKRYIPVGMQLHGEFLIDGDNGVLPREVGNGILNKILKGGELPDDTAPLFVCWDIVPFSVVQPKHVFMKPYKERLKQLEDCVGEGKRPSWIEVAPYKIVHSKEEALQHYEEMLAQGKEGTVLKNSTMFWRDGTSKEQLKLKLEVAVDLVCYELTEGKGKNKDTFGAMVCESRDGSLIVGVSGFTDEMRKYIFDNWDSICGKIIAVKANALMKPTDNNPLWSLFLPRFVEIREDKTVADTVKQVIDQFDNAMSGG
jgi:DNA ligase 1